MGFVIFESYIVNKVILSYLFYKVDVIEIVFVCYWLVVVENNGYFGKYLSFFLRGLNVLFILRYYRNFEVLYCKYFF